MGVDRDPALESTLQWYRFPLSWLDREEKENALVDRLKNAKD